MKISLVQVDDLIRKPIDLDGALSFEIELDNGDRFGISLSTKDHIDIHSNGQKMILQVEPRAANAIYIRVR